ncbi:MAG: Na+/H+ antiporter [Candidatus Eremiobacteraeota bacterium]|nr:Na+/H+ antiporter [Candidatus Eremiobacteraeota bacterium]
MSHGGSFDMELSIERIVELLIVATVVALITKKIRVPYTVALVLIGIAIGVNHLLLPFSLSTDVILLLFLPPLLFEGTLSMDLEILREKWREVLLLAFPVTFLSVLAIGAGAHYFLGYSWTISLFLGAILSPTDPISVLALFKELGVSKRLSLMVEGESCFNDGLGVVLFLIFSRFVAGENVAASKALLLFVSEVAGGLAVGIVLGYAVYRIMKYIDDHLIEVMISVILAFGAYILAERLHFSGVMAVVAAGLIVGNYGRVFSMSPSTRLVLSSFWQVMAFIANSLLFLLMGIAMESAALGHYAGKIALIFMIILIGRLIFVFLMGLLLKATGRPMPFSWQLVIGWSGLRGSIPVALALGVTLPAAGGGIPVQKEFVTLIFGVVAVSILLNGLTIKPLIARLGLAKKDEHESDFEFLIGRRMALSAAHGSLQEMNSTGQIPHDFYEKLFTILENKSSRLREEMTSYLEKHPGVAYSRHDDILIALARAERTAVEDAFMKGLISEETFTSLRKEIDRKIEQGSETAEIGGEAPLDAEEEVSRGLPLAEDDERQDTAGEA